MNILWFSWKDIQHPLAGGAEVVSSELAKRLVKDGHQVTFITSSFKNAQQHAKIDGYKIVRVGNRYSVYFKARRYYKKHIRGWADVVIEEINTIPFFTKFYIKEPRSLFVHQLCRQIWFYQLPKPLGLVGYLAEPLYLRLLNNQKVITVSDSTKKDLVRNGFKPSNIVVISEGIQIAPVSNLGKIKKYNHPTVLSLGAMRSMKRTLDQIKAFEIAKSYVPDLQLKVAGDASGSYGKKVLKAIQSSNYQDDIEYLGKISAKAKIDLMQRAHLILATSVKEGWGLTVTEAASQGTPAAVYNVDGLRDSVRNNQTGLIAQQNNPYYLAGKILAALKGSEVFSRLQHNAWQWSKQINFSNSYKDFKGAIKL